MTLNRLQFVVVFPLLTLMLSGCGGSDRPSLAPASGIIKLNGVPVEGASVTFLPAEGGRPGSAVSDAQGRYTIKTYEDAPGAIVGSHKVSVVKISGAGAYAIQKDAPAESSAQSESDGSDSLSEILVTDSASTTEPEIVYEIPERYMDPNRSGLMIIVPDGGSNELDLELVD